MHVASAAGAETALLSDPASLSWLGAGDARHLLVHEGTAVAIAADGDPQLPRSPRFARSPMSEREAVPAALARALSDAGVGPRDPVAVEPAQLPRALVRVLGHDTCRDVGDALAGMRARKDDAELTLVESAARLADTGAGALRANLRAGLTELELRSRVRAAVTATAGSETEARVELEVGARGAPADMPLGRDAATADDPLLLMLSCEHDGYWAATGIAVCCERPSSALRGRHAVVWAALQRGLRAVRPGATTGDVDRAMRDQIVGAGLRCPHRTGYAIGRSPQEAPLLLPGGTTRLGAGATLVLAPAGYAGEAGVRLAQTVVVATGGARPLTASPRDLA